MSMGIAQKSRKLPYVYRAIVEDNADPLMYGRVKARIYPMFANTETIATDQLPWAVPAMGIFVGSGDGYGSFTVPDIDTMIFVFFEAGDPYQPVYFASAADGMMGHPADYAMDYPLTRVMKTKNGIQVRINDKKDSEDVKVSHPSGSSIEMLPDGNIIITTVKEGANVTVNVGKGNINLNSTNNEINLVAGGSVNIVAPETIVVGNLRAVSAATGTFSSGTGDVIDVRDGIIVGGLR